MHAVIGADLDDEPRHSRVQMHVLVRVDVVERETGRAKRLELRPDFGREQSACLRAEEKPQTGSKRVVVEAAVAANEAAEFLRRQDRIAVDQHEVKTDMEVRVAPCPRDGVGRSWGTDHQASGGQDAVAMRPLDRLIDRNIATEIIGGDDQPPEAQGQLAISRSRRNWKNSRPSRTRRRIISGLLSISPSSEAILRRRK